MNRRTTCFARTHEDESAEEDLHPHPSSTSPPHPLRVMCGVRQVNFLDSKLLFTGIQRRDFNMAGIPGDAHCSPGRFQVRWAGKIAGAGWRLPCLCLPACVCVCLPDVEPRGQHLRTEFCSFGSR
ncbi:hypothetical protein GN956_G24304 [Arapaima gigas]